MTEEDSSRSGAAHLDLTAWMLDCLGWLLSTRGRATYFLDEATMVLGSRGELPTDAPPGTLEQAQQLLDAITVHAGRDHVEHEIVREASNDAAMEAFEPNEAVGVPIGQTLHERWGMIAMLSRGVVTPIVLDGSGEPPGGELARGPAIDLATVLAGFGVPILRAAALGSVLGERGVPRDAGSRHRDLDGREVALAHALFELVHGISAAETDRALPDAAPRAWMRDARRELGPHQDAILKIVARARGAVSAYRDGT